MIERSDHSGQPVPDPRKAAFFEFCLPQYDPETGTARLPYRFENGPLLVETIRFPRAPWPLEKDRQAAFFEALNILHLVAGVSYYKAGLSPQMRVETPGMSAASYEFLDRLYVQGLAEFAYRNELDVAGQVRFPPGDAPAQARGLELPDRALVAMGGGKDSLVGLALVQKAGVEVMPVCVGRSRLIAETVEAAELPLLRIQRDLAPELRDMNAMGAWNGHVPVTAINSAILLCASLLYGYRHIVFSNERSADEATLHTEEGTAVNHQYSKSSEFEAGFRQLIAATVTPDIEYFSVLRPFSELEIVRKFSEMKAFHRVYSSCNRNFHLDGPRVTDRWCLDCPKCRFAALSLAVFLPPAEVSAIMGGDLLDDMAQQDGFRALCQLGRDKPFECVGEAGESRAALAALGKNPAWSAHAVVRSLLPDLAAVETPPLQELLKPSARHFIPRELGAVSLAGDLRIAILGTGREGQSAWRHLRRLYPGHDLVLFDEAEPDEEFRAQLSDNDRLEVGSLDHAALDEFDLLVRSPGISPYRPGLQAARAAGVRITSPSNLWFAAHPHARTICVTGTKGKSTTSALLAHMLRHCGYRVQLAGNIGRPLLDCEAENVDWWVIELSSYQLADLEAAPDVSVLLNLSSEHLDWHGSEAVYRQDKMRLIELAGDRPVVANAADFVLRDSLAANTSTHWFNSNRGFHVNGPVLSDGETALGIAMPDSLPGAHNLANTAAALTVLRVIGADVNLGAGAVSSFRGLPHRLQAIGESEGIRYVNDSISSAPVATAAALEALQGCEVTLIVGGLDRGVDWTPYMSAIALRAPNAVIAIPDNGADIVLRMQNAGLQTVRGLHAVDDLAAAVSLARELTPPGGVVLLSPGAPSFPHFRDFRDRGCQFARLCGFEADDREPA